MLTGRDAERAQTIAADVGGDVRGIALDLSEPDTIAGALADVGELDHVVIAAIERDANTAKDYDIMTATRLVTLKLIGYTEVVHTLLPRLSTTHRSCCSVDSRATARTQARPPCRRSTAASAGWCTRWRPSSGRSGSTRCTRASSATVPFWSGKEAAIDAVKARTPLGRNVAMADIVDGVDFLLRNRSVNGIELAIDGGWLLL